MSAAPLTYPCFEADTRPAPVMPAPLVPGLPDLVVEIMQEAHARAVTEGWGHYRLANDPNAKHRPIHRKLSLEHAAKATSIVQCFRDAGHKPIAALLREKAKELEEALYAIPEDLQERMDLMDMAVPGERE